MRLIIQLFLLLMPVTSLASSIDVGGQGIEVPTPLGYAPVTSGMSGLYEAQNIFASPANEKYITFIPEALVPSALRGEIPELSTWFSVQTVKAIAAKSVSSTDFSRLKEQIRTETSRLTKEIEAQAPGLLGEINRNISSAYNVEQALSLSQMVPLSVHHETERSIAYSAFVKYNINDQSGQLTSTVTTSVTLTMILVNTRALFLYTYGGENDLEWTRAASRVWAEEIIKQNSSIPITSSTAAGEARPEVQHSPTIVDEVSGALMTADAWKWAAIFLAFVGFVIIPVIYTYWRTVINGYASTFLWLWSFISVFILGGVVAALLFALQRIGNAWFMAVPFGACFVHYSILKHYERKHAASVKDA